MNKLVLLVLGLTIAFFSGCSTVPLEPNEVSQNSKSFKKPPKGNAGLYIFRDSYFGASLKKDIWIDNKCLGESSSRVFFYKSVKGNKKHKVSTESEFSPNNLIINTKSGKNYFVRQYIKMGLAVGGADLELVDEVEGKDIVSELDMAKNGFCSE